MGIYANSQESIFFKKKKQKKNNVKFRKMLANLGNFYCVSVARWAQNTKKCARLVIIIHEILDVEYESVCASVGVCVFG